MLSLIKNKTKNKRKQPLLFLFIFSIYSSLFFPICITVCFDREGWRNRGVFCEPQHTLDDQNLEAECWAGAYKRKLGSEHSERGTSCWHSCELVILLVGVYVKIQINVSPVPCMILNKCCLFGLLCAGSVKQAWT